MTTSGLTTPPGHAGTVTVATAVPSVFSGAGVAAVASTAVLVMLRLTQPQSTGWGMLYVVEVVMLEGNSSCGLNRPWSCRYWSTTHAGVSTGVPGHSETGAVAGTGKSMFSAVVTTYVAWMDTGAPSKSGGMVQV